jgi:hypothetical protein
MKYELRPSPAGKNGQSHKPHSHVEYLGKGPPAGTQKGAGKIHEKGLESHGDQGKRNADKGSHGGEYGKKRREGHCPDGYFHIEASFVNLFYIWLTFWAYYIPFFTSNKQSLKVKALKTARLDRTGK